LHDPVAAARLRGLVQDRYETHTGERFTKTGLAAATGIGRPTLDNWLERGVMPTVEGMTSLGKACGVPAAQLWVKWLDLGMSDPLVRIADALDRAYPVIRPDAALEDEAEAATDRTNETLQGQRPRPLHTGP
jgi:transcriptional regulator with XRE-family HTH domain